MFLTKIHNIKSAVVFIPKENTCQALELFSSGHFKNGKAFHQEFPFIQRNKCLS